MITTPVLAAPIDRSLSPGGPTVAGSDQSLYYPPIGLPAEGVDQSFIGWPHPAEGVDQ